MASRCHGAITYTAVIPTVAAALALVAAATASADGGGSCNKTAAVRSGTVLAIDTTTGLPVEGALQQLRRGRNHPYSVTGGSASVVFQGVRYELAEGSSFLLGCFGESRAVRARFPRLVLGGGRVEVTTAAGRTGAVSNAAAMVNPRERIAMTFRVKARSYTHLKARKDRAAPGRLAAPRTPARARARAAT